MATGNKGGKKPPPRGGSFEMDEDTIWKSMAKPSRAAAPAPEPKMPPNAVQMIGPDGKPVPLPPGYALVPLAKPKEKPQPPKRLPPVRRSQHIMFESEVLAKFGRLETTDAQKKLLTSQFDGNKSFGRLTGEVAAMPEKEDDGGETLLNLGKQYDGSNAPPELTSRDLGIAVLAPAQSKQGRRDPAITANVINQFAVGHNPRYTPDAPDQTRAHIFLWDVSRAMNAEVPHFQGRKEMTLAQTVDWLRNEGTMRGWRRANAPDALAAAQDGQLVVALPKDARIKAMAVVRPKLGPDGRARFAAAGKRPGNELTLMEALGVYSAEYFLHP